MPMAARLLFALVVLFIAANRAAAEDSAPSFFLDLDTGGHRAAVKDVAWTPDGQFLVSASDDKTIRVWDAASGVSVRTIRGQIGPGNEGKVFAVAVSPDGKTIAAGGWFGPGLGESPPYGDIRLFDLATGRIKGVLKHADLPTYSLAFSPDGTKLAAGGQDGLVFLWRKDATQASGWSFERDWDAESNGITRVGFALGGTRLVATTSDNGFALWDLAKGALVDIGEAESWRDAPIRALAVSADGKSFATGSDDGRAALWNAADGALIGELPRESFAVGSLLLAEDRILVSCGYRCADRNRTTIWRLGEQKPLREYRGHDGRVAAGAVAPDGRLAATAGGQRHAIRLWDPVTGETKAVLRGSGSPVTAVGIEPETQTIAWGTENPCPAEVVCPEALGKLEAALALPQADRFFEEPETLGADAAGFSRAAFEQGGWSLHAEAGGEQGLGDAVLAVSKSGKPLHAVTKTAEDGARHAAFTLLDGGTRFITGDNDGALLEYDSERAELLGAFEGGHSGSIEALAVSEQRNLLVSGSADQTIGLWNLQTRELIVSMFFAGPEWVVWMPQGFYISSDEGDKLIGWHVNQGQDVEGRFIRAGQLKKYLWSPEMVRRAIILRSAEAAVREMRPGTDRKLETLLRREPPEFSLRVADDQSGVRDGFVAVEVSGAEDASSDTLSILSNSRNVGAAASRGIGGDGESTIIEVPVEEGENRVSVTATDAFGYLTERSVTAISRKRAQPRKGKLFAAVIGVDDYPFLSKACGGRSCNLRFPVNDAAAFLAMIAERTAPMFSGMETLFLVNRDALEAEPNQARSVSRFLDKSGEPDADTISDTLADFLDKPGPDDTTLVFVAGHGINLDEDYYFVPTDARKGEGDRWKRSTLVDWGDIQKAVERTEGTRIMLLDTCHAAGAFNPRLEKDAADARIVVFSATAANNTAAELPELGHGVFTYSLLEGLKGKAGSAADGVRMLGLADFLDREVERLTSNRQKPFFYISNMENIRLAGP